MLMEMFVTQPLLFEKINFTLTDFCFSLLHTLHKAQLFLISDICKEVFVIPVGKVLHYDYQVEHYAKQVRNWSYALKNSNRFD